MLKKEILMVLGGAVMAGSVLSLFKKFQDRDVIVRDERIDHEHEENRKTASHECRRATQVALQNGTCDPCSPNEMQQVHVKEPCQSPDHGGVSDAGSACEGCGCEKDSKQASTSTSSKLLPDMEDRKLSGKDRMLVNVRRSLERDGVTGSKECSAPGEVGWMSAGAANRMLNSDSDALGVSAEGCWEEAETNGWLDGHQQDPGRHPTCNGRSLDMEDGEGEGWEVVETFLEFGDSTDGEDSADFFDAEEAFVSALDSLETTNDVTGRDTMPPNLWRLVNKLMIVEDYGDEEDTEEVGKKDLSPLSVAPLSSQDLAALLAECNACDTPSSDFSGWRLKESSADFPAGSILHHVSEAEAASDLVPVEAAEADAEAASGGGTERGPRSKLMLQAWEEEQVWDGVEEASALLGEYIEQELCNALGDGDGDYASSEDDLLADADLAEGSECSSVQLDVNPQEVAALATALSEAPFFSSPSPPSLAGGLPVEDLRLSIQGVPLTEEGDAETEVHETLWFRGVDPDRGDDLAAAYTTRSSGSFGEELDLDQMIALMEEVAEECSPGPVAHERGDKAGQAAWAHPSPEEATLWILNPAGPAISVA